MSDSAKTTRSVSDHPLLLTTLVLYSIVLGLPLGKFPPIDWPAPSDLFMAGVVLVLLVRMALTFYYATVAEQYPSQLFVLEVAIAGIFAWQFRVLLDERVDGPESRLWLFYVLHLALIVTMVVWGRILLSASYRPPRRVLVLRAVGAVAAGLGLVIELPAVATELRMAGRWAVACVLMVLAVAYAVGRPWRQFETADSQGPAPERPSSALHGGR